MFINAQLFPKYFGGEVSLNMIVKDFTGASRIEEDCSVEEVRDHAILMLSRCIEAKDCSDNSIEVEIIKELIPDDLIDKIVEKRAREGE